MQEASRLSTSIQHGIFVQKSALQRFQNPVLLFIEILMARQHLALEFSWV